MSQAEPEHGLIENSELYIKRIIYGIGANFFAQAVTILIQFVSVPLLLIAWGASRYGTWAILMTIPSYLSFADLGFIYAAGNGMAFAIGREDHLAAERLFKSLWSGLFFVAAAIAIVMVVLASLVPSQFLFSATTSSGEIRYVIICLSVSTIVSFYTGVGVASFRADGKYARGIFKAELIRLFETIGILAGAMIGGDLLSAAIFGVVCKTIGTVILLRSVVREVEWAKPSIRLEYATGAKELFKPALAIFSVPVGFALLVQGTTLVVGAVAGPAAVATYNSTRTLTRSGIQLAGLVCKAIGPEISLAVGAKDNRITRRLVILNWLSLIVTVVPISTILIIYGPAILLAWTRGRIAVDQGLLHLLIASSIFQAIWNTNADILLASGKAAEFSKPFAACCLMALVAAIWLGSKFSIQGVATSQLGCDGVLAIFILWKVTQFMRSRLT